MGAGRSWLFTRAVRFSVPGRGLFRLRLPEWDNGWNPRDCNMLMHLTTTQANGVDGADARSVTRRPRLNVASPTVRLTPIDRAEPQRGLSGGARRVHPGAFPASSEA